MTPAPLISDPRLWPERPEEAAALQREWAPLVRTEPLDPEAVRLVAGLDVSYSRDDTHLAAAVVVLDASTLEVVESAVISAQPRFPYISGLFAFRELPPLLAALERLSAVPDVYMCDGAGLAHPRRFGLACHLGLLLDRPALGVAKSASASVATPDTARGCWTPLRIRGDTVGRCLRTQEGTRPVYVSAGHRIDLDGACALTLRVSPHYRVPEPVRCADRLSRSALAAEAAQRR